MVSIRVCVCYLREAVLFFELAFFNLGPQVKWDSYWANCTNKLTNGLLTSLFHLKWSCLGVIGSTSKVKHIFRIEKSNFIDSCQSSVYRSNRFNWNNLCYLHDTTLCHASKLTRPWPSVFNPVIPSRILILKTSILKLQFPRLIFFLRQSTLPRVVNPPDSNWLRLAF